MKLGKRYDTLIFKAADKATLVYGHLTGKDNFSLARILVKVGSFGAALRCMIILAVGISEQSIIVVVLYLYCLWIIYDIRRDVLKYISILENAVNSESGTIPFSERDYIAMAVLARIWSVFGIFMMIVGALALSPLSAVYGLFMFMMAFSLYVMASPPGQKKKYLEKVKAKAKDFKEKLQDLIPSPVPAPVPIRA